MRCVRNPVVCMVLAALGCSSHQGLSKSQGGKQSAVPLGEIYNGTSPEFTSAIMGYFSADVALVDLNRDGYQDMLISNGSDMSPQSLTVFYNHQKEIRSVFRNWPDWYSDVTEYMNGMAVGDINQDGGTDVAVAVAFDKSRNIGTGSIKVFLNGSRELQRNPAYEVAADGFMPIDCALADVDIDGDLDLIVAALIEGQGIFAEGFKHSPGRARIYLNHGGRLSSTPDWTSADGIGAGSVTAADINQDGWLDLAFGSPQPKIYYGKPGHPNQITIPKTPDWTAATPPVKAEIPVYNIDAGSPGRSDQHSSTVPAPDTGLMMAVSPGCGTNLDSPCESPFFLYRPDQNTKPIWASKRVRFPNGIALADLNQDGYLDLVTGHMNTSFRGGPIWLFRGPFPTDSKRPSVKLNIRRMWQSFSVGNLHCGSVANATLSHTFRINGPVTVLTLPQRIVANVLEVSQNDRRLKWTWSPEDNWVALAQPVTDTVITVTYTSPMILDLAAANWNPSRGSSAFFSFLNCAD